MEQYIKKSVVLAEIRRRMKSLIPLIGFTTKNPKEVSMGMARIELEKLLSFIDTLEVKEVNEVPATVMVNQYGLRFISSWFGLKEYDDLKEGEEIKILIPNK